MKNIKLLFIALMLPMTGLFAQVPQAMKYQTVIRNAEGTPITNSNIGLQLTILEDGQDVYQETYDMDTNEFGLIHVNLGQGNTSDNFSSIDWTGSDYELEIGVDSNGGSNYQIIGTSPMLTVPFAMTAKTALEVDDADANPTNELQSLTLSGNTLSISNGNSVTLPSSSGADDEQLAKVWARVDIFGNSSTTFDSYNVTATTKSTTGVYVISLSPGLFSTATNPSVNCTINNDLSPGVAIATYASSPSQITVRTYDMDGNLSDRAFSIQVFGK